MDIMNDKAYIEEQRVRIGDLKAMLQDQYQKTRELEQQLALARQNEQGLLEVARRHAEDASTLRQDNAAMRALLERAGFAIGMIKDHYDDYAKLQTLPP